MAASDGRSKPDLAAGIPIHDLPDGAKLAGTVDGEDVLLVRRGGELFAVGGQCTHYHAPLVDGLLVDDTVRCPWHHACFSLRSGEAIRAPAFDALARWRVEQLGDTVFVRETLPGAPARRFAGGARSGARPPASVLIVGGGAGGHAAADMLRREGYDGPVAIVSADAAAPCDRPNLSKDYLAGAAPEEWLALRPADEYPSRGIELVLGTRVEALDVAARRVRLANGTAREYGALVLATGADPVRLEVAGEPAPTLFYLRTVADSRAIVAAAASAKGAIVVGASFIGLEVAASLRARGLEVHVVAPETQPLERVMGPEIGGFVRGVHEKHGVVFHLGRTVRRVDGRVAHLDDGSTLEADFVVLGVGVRPATALAEHAGLALDRGVVVDEYLETSAPGVYAVGDIARWPDPHTGERIRVEHWVVAQRQGQAAARNILGAREPFDAVPFFWSQHYDVAINYVGHAERWDAIEIDGSLAARDFAARFMRGGRALAVATVSRDLANLEAERRMERGPARV